MTDYHGVVAEADKQLRRAATNGLPSDPIQASGLLRLPIGADVMDASNALRRLAPLLSGLDQLGRLTHRHRAVAVLNEAGITGAAGMVDAALAGSGAPGATTADPGQGQLLTLRDPEPWPDAVDGPAVLNTIAQTFLRFLALPAGAADALALWTVHTFALDAALVSPVLAVVSPEKRCGKTTLLKLLSALVARPLHTAGVTPAALFRCVERFVPTLLLDEADTVFRDSEELRAVVNASHDRASACVLRTVGEDHDPRAFSTWCPKAIALIGKLPGTLTDRAVVVSMRRRRPEESVERLRLDRLSDLAPLRRQALRWAKDHLATLREADATVPDALNDRAADNWRPLLAIADQAGGEWPARARQSALLLSESAAGEDDAPAVLLLADIQGYFKEQEVDRVATADLLAHLTGLETRPWPEWKQGRPLTARQLAGLLNRFGVVPHTIRDGGVTMKGYLLSDLGESFSRYLPPSDPSHRHNPHGDRVSAELSSVTPELLLRMEEPPNSLRTNGVTDVTDGREGEGGRGDVYGEDAEEQAEADMRAALRAGA